MTKNIDIEKLAKEAELNIPSQTWGEVYVKLKAFADLYATSQRQQPLKRLTDEQINKCFEKVMFDEEAEPTRERIANAIMDAMQELNK